MSKYIPPVFSDISLKIFTSAANDMIFTLMRSLIKLFRVSCILLGSQVVKLPKITTISREACVGKCLILRLLELYQLKMDNVSKYIRH